MPRDSDDEPDPDDEDDFEQEPEMDTSMRHAIIVDHVPSVPKEKLDKLRGVLSKFFGQIGRIVEGGLEIPTDPSTGQSLGCAARACVCMRARARCRGLAQSALPCVGSLDVGCDSPSHACGRLALRGSAQICVRRVRV